MPRNPSLEEKEVPMWVNVVSTISFLICLIIFIFAIVTMVQMPKVETTHQNRYEAYYGTFTSGSRYYFDSYTVNGNQYIFYDVNGNFVGEIYVSGNNNLSIRSR